MPGTAPFPKDARVRLIIDATQSNVVVQVLAAGILSAFAHSPRIAALDVRGSVDLTTMGGTLTGSTLSLRIRSDSLEVTDDYSEKDREEIRRRMRQEVLETDQYPEIVYECSRLTASGAGDRYWVVLKGDLTLCGITRATPITAKVSISGDNLRASGEFTLRQSDFGVVPVTAVAGTIRVKDELKCTFDVLARRQE